MILDQPQITQPNVNDIVNSIRMNVININFTMKAQHTQAFNQIWNNQNFTPKEIVDAFGTDAAALFTLSYELQQILLAADPTYVMLIPPVSVTINSDGT